MAYGMPNSYYQGFQNNNPYLQQTYNPYQQYNQQFMNTQETINGCIVDSEDVVKSKNCNLDGTSTYYPLSDNSAIYVKKLNPQTGAGMIFKYELKVPKQQNVPTTEQQVATLLASFKSEISNEISELKTLVLDSVTTPKEENKMQFINKQRGDK